MANGKERSANLGARSANREDLSPLALAALGLVRDGATSRDLAERFGAAGAEIAATAAERLLAELASFGLVRVARGSGTDARYVLTSLGGGFVDRSLRGEVPAKLDELERLRTTLLSTIAHELRTPLTAIRTSAGLLLEASVSPSLEQREAMLRTIERNAERMQGLIGDVLDLSRYRSGVIRLQSRRFDATELADAVIDAVQPLAETRRQRLERSGEARIMVFGDRRRLERALLNLVSNAQRFAPDGGHVLVAVERAGAEVRWTVSDDGPGIPEDERGHLFERFFVGGGDRHTEVEGVGLGLPTALAIAQAHGGRIEVESAPGSGSTFVLVVPAAGPVEDEVA